MKNNLFPVVIIAGGLATRLHPLTETIPKSLLNINSEPFIAHQLRLLHKKGIQNIVLCLGYLGKMVMDYVNNNNQFGLNISYVFDGPTLLGTAGAIKRALPILDEAFFVLNGDSYLLCDYSAVQTTFIKSQKQALMTVFHNQGRWDNSNILFSDGRILMYDKHHPTSHMLHIDYGLSVFKKSAFSMVPENIFFDLSTVYQALLKQNQLAAYEVSERFYEIGSYTGISELTHYFSQDSLSPI
jgi:N-acetyl-alpha-D-muramate 1-phosphate uridylyltransferase